MIEFNISNIPIHYSNFDELKSLFEDVLNSANGSQLITTFNLDFLRIANEDSQFHNICRNSLYNFPDGFGITSLIKNKYKTKIKRITGNDIFPLLISLSKKNNLKVAVVGASKEVSEAVENKIKKDFSFEEDMLLCISPPQNFEINQQMNEQIVNRISAFSPSIVFAALGCPRQEKWLYENMNEFGSILNIGIGATLDYFTGAQKRSPVFIQAMGFEWFWRLINEPERLFKRYIKQDLPFFIKSYFSKKL